MKAQLSAIEIAEWEEATVWGSGLDHIYNVRGINFCADFSGTPFYIQGSGDLGGADRRQHRGAHPQVLPVAGWINSRHPASERRTARRRARPGLVLREVEDALSALASEWKRTSEEFEKAGSPVPPVLIVVCDNTDLVKLVQTHRQGNPPPGSWRTTSATGG